MKWLKGKATRGAVDQDNNFSLSRDLQYISCVKEIRKSFYLIVNGKQEDKWTAVLTPLREARVLGGPNVMAFWHWVWRESTPWESGGKGSKSSSWLKHMAGNDRAIPFDKDWILKFYARTKAEHAYFLLTAKKALILGSDNPEQRNRKFIIPWRDYG